MKNIISARIKRAWQISRLIDRKDCLRLAVILHTGTTDERIAALCGLKWRSQNTEVLSGFILEQLRHPSPKVRYAAFSALRDFKSKELYGLLSDPHPVVRQHAIGYMGWGYSFERDDIFVPAVVQSLEKQYPDIPVELARLLTGKMPINLYSSHHLPPSKEWLTAMPVYIRMTKHRDGEIRSAALEFLARLNAIMDRPPVPLDVATRIANCITEKHLIYHIIMLLKPYGHAAYPAVENLKHPGIRAAVQMGIMGEDPGYKLKFNDAQNRFIVQNIDCGQISAAIRRSNVFPRLIKTALRTIRSDKSLHSMSYLEDSRDCRGSKLLVQSAYNELNSRNPKKLIFALRNAMEFKLLDTLPIVTVLCNDHNAEVAKLAVEVIESFAKQNSPDAVGQLLALAGNTTHHQRSAALAALLECGIDNNEVRVCLTRAFREFHPAVCKTPGVSSCYKIQLSILSSFPRSYISDLLKHPNQDARVLAYIYLKEYLERHASVCLPRQWIEAIRTHIANATADDYSWYYQVAAMGEVSENQLISFLLPLLKHGNRREKDQTAKLFIRLLDYWTKYRPVTNMLIAHLDEFSSATAAEAIVKLRDIPLSFRQRSIVMRKVLALASHGSANIRAILDDGYAEFGYLVTAAFRNTKSSKAQAG